IGLHRNSRCEEDDPMFAGNVFDRHATFRRSLSASLLTGIVFAMTASASGQTGQKAIVPAFFGIGQHTDLKKGTDWARIASQGTNVLAVVADDSFTTLTGS